MQADEYHLLERLRALNLAIRRHVAETLRNQDPATLSQVAREAPEDTIYRIDEGVEEVLLSFCDEWSRERPFALVAEGLSGGRRMFPPDRPERDAEFLLIADPIDGTRPLMYDKRSAWALTAVAEHRGGRETARDIVAAAQTELPTSRQSLGAHLSAGAETGLRAEQHNLLTGEVKTLHLHPSAADTLLGGFGGFVKFFPAGKAECAALESELLRMLYGAAADTAVFDDQYISSGGQLFELMAGHDRFVADVRPLLTSGPRSHPYDLCTEIIARKAGVIVTDLGGERLSFPLDVTTPVGWVGYANEALRDAIQPALGRLLRAMAPR